MPRNSDFSVRVSFYEGYGKFLFYCESISFALSETENTLEDEEWTEFMSWVEGTDDH